MVFRNERLITLHIMILSMLIVQLFRHSREIMRALPSNHQFMTFAILWEHMYFVKEQSGNNWHMSCIKSHLFIFLNGMYDSLWTSWIIVSYTKTKQSNGVR